MASIKGIEIKNIKKFSGVEYPENFQGTIYYKGKKLGFWSQDSWGGPDYYDFNTEELDKVAEEYFGKDSYYDLDCLLYDILNLKEYEKKYKKAIKNGYSSIVVITDGTYETTVNVPNDTNKESVLNKSRQFIDTFKNADYTNTEEIKIHIFTNISDFVK